MRNDEHIWLKLKAGERDAYELLFHSYYKDLYRYGVKFCGCSQQTEDEIQNLFLKIWIDRKKLGDVLAVKTYLWTALRRRLIVASEKKKKENIHAGNYVSEATFSLSVEEFIIKNEEAELLKEQLKKVVETLSPKQREVLYLKFYEGMSYEEIGEIMAVNYQVTRNYLYQGLQKIRKKFPEKAAVIHSLLILLL